jgi:NAD(P)-dependent dehydrogenase (short-subunit alcohol dehydrogenase family)
LATVFITGANRGLGLEFAQQYAAEGWRVLAACRDPARADSLRALGGKVEIHALDVTNRTAIDALAAKLGGQAIDVWIANAGVMTAGPKDSPPEIEDAAWAEAFRVNVVAPITCAAAFVGAVAKSEQRKMLVMSSWIGSIGSNEVGGHYVYRASKAALNAVWRSFAIDHPQVISAALSPGALRTDMTRYDGERWAQLPEPAENIARLRAIIARLTPADSGSFFHFNGERLPW